MNFRFFTFISLIVLLSACKSEVKKDTSITEEQESSTTDYFNWKGATVYFMLTDRFNNGDTTNDLTMDRTKETAKLRGFMGGDIKGITQKIKEGYFNDLGVNAIWFTPVMQQIKDGTDEGTGYTYSYHGYWIKDWTAIDPNFGTMEDLSELVDTAHERGIRVLLDAVINHHGPVTPMDPPYPEDWVRFEPKCEYDTYESTVTCTLVENLPDIKTETNEAVELPPQLVAKWKEEGRYDKEMAELDTFFTTTGYPRAPRFYIMKWLSDYVKEMGVDGFRVDTARHVEAYVWSEFQQVCTAAFKEWKTNYPDKVLDDTPFYTVGEIYDYTIDQGRLYDFGNRKVDYYYDALSALINFDLKATANKTYEEVYSTYDSILNGSLKQVATLSYLSSHDDTKSYDMSREKPFEAATRLLLSPGGAQIYYGDETARPLLIEGTNGDATLRSFMNWEDLKTEPQTQAIYEHWKKLGQFRNNHFAVGAGIHKLIGKEPYTFARVLKDGDYDDRVIVIMNAPEDQTEFVIDGIFEEGAELRDAYSGQLTQVKDHRIRIKAENGLLLLEEVN